MHTTKYIDKNVTIRYWYNKIVDIVIYGSQELALLPCQGRYFDLTAHFLHLRNGITK